MDARQPRQQDPVLERDRPLHHRGSARVASSLSTQIPDEQALITDVIRVLFAQRDFASFSRQLNLCVCAARPSG